MKRNTTPQIGRAQRQKLLGLVEDIKNFKTSVSIDDPDSMYVYGLCVRDLIEPLKVVASPILSPEMASQLNTIEIEPNDFVSASNAMARATGLVPGIEDAIESLNASPGGKIAMRQGHCPECGPDRSAEVIAAKELNRTRYESSEFSTTAVDIFRILQCRGCAAVYFQQESMFSEDWDIEFNPDTGETESGPKRYITHWPPPRKIPLPEWIGHLTDADLIEILHEIHGSHDSGYVTLAAIGVRTALDRAFVLSGADPAASFAEKLQALRDDDVVTETERQSLEGLTDAGSAAAHRAWKPQPAVIEAMIESMEAFLHRVFVQQVQAQAIRAATPKKPKRTEKKTKSSTTTSK